MHNVDLSKIVRGHMDYANKLNKILVSLGYADQVVNAEHVLRRVSSLPDLRDKEPIIRKSKSLTDLVDDLPLLDIPKIGGC